MADSIERGVLRLRVIGIDPGSRFCGYGVVEKKAGRLIHVDCGVIVPNLKGEMPYRLREIQEGVEDVIARYVPKTAAIEEVFFSRNWQSALKLGQARGVCLVALAKNGLTVHEYAATFVKKNVVGYGRAQKTQIQEMVRVLLGLPEVPEENAADALAIAICHANSYRVLEGMKK